MFLNAVDIPLDISKLINMQRLVSVLSNVIYNYCSLIFIIFDRTENQITDNQSIYKKDHKQ